MFRGRRTLIALVAMLTVALVASGPAEAKKKKKKQPVAQQGISDSVSIISGIPARGPWAPLNEAEFEFEWIKPNNARAEIEATFTAGPGGGFNDVDIFVEDSSGTEVADVAGADCDTTPASGCSTENGHELKGLPKLPLGTYTVIFQGYQYAGANFNVDFTITFFNAAGKPGPAPAPA